MKALNQLEIPKRSPQCAHNKEPLTGGMDIISFIYEEGDQHQLARSDYCTTCWQAVSQEVASKPHSRGYWKSKIEVRKQSAESSRTGKALQLLREMIQNPESSLEEIFVLALFLSHARQLLMRQEFEERGEAYQLYEIAKQDEFITIKIVNLSNLQIEEIQKSLAQKLKV